MSGGEKIAVRVTEVTPLNEMVTRFRFERTDGGLLPTFSGGSHTVVEMKDGGITRLNPYSLMSDPFDRSSYAISVRRDDAGRGGSLFLHRRVKVGDELTISNPVNLFTLDLRAKKHLMIAGGIGITPFLSQIQELVRIHGRWNLHYAARSAALGAYAEELTNAHPAHVHTYFKDEGQALDLEALLSKQPVGTHVYVCGPKGMIEAVTSTAREIGWPEEAIHYEEFLAPEAGETFTAYLAKSDKTVEVGEHESLLEAIERVGLEPPYLCRGGACGQCETDVLEYDGEIIHRDHWLEPEEHRSGKKIMPCVSRFVGKKLVLDR